MKQFECMEENKNVPIGHQNSPLEGYSWRQSIRSAKPYPTILFEKSVKLIIFMVLGHGSAAMGFYT